MKSFLLLALTTCCLLSYMDLEATRGLIAISDIDPSVFDKEFNDDHDDEKGESGYHFSRMVNIRQNNDIAIAEKIHTKNYKKHETFYQKRFSFIHTLWHNQTWYKLSSSEGIRWHSVGDGKTPKTD